MNTFAKCILVASVALASFATTACGEPSDDAATATSNLDERGRPNVAEGADKVTSCWGSEPFWSIAIDSSKVQFKSFDDSTQTIANKGATPAQGSTAAWAALYQGTTTESPNKNLSVIITSSECHDESNDTFDWSVSVVHGDQLFLGCCR
ncbi:MAG: hypothetical protein KIT84_30375 [Labilithrix sp.]|nr:hypothetical protein [Labilithrix sp.]MCW5815372.1 hypothetical protein [Labilithrix sp.]